MDSNILKVKTDFCLMDWIPDRDLLRERYGDMAADNYIVWNFWQRLGDVKILSISVAQIVSYQKTLPNVPDKIMYMCVYEDSKE
jgi:hypothetical protein